MSDSPPIPQRRRVALWNAAFGYATLGSTLARNILLVPLYLKFVALGEYGAWLATGGALVQMLVTDYGLSGVITQRIAVLSGAGATAQQRTTIIAGLVNAAFLGVLLTAAGSLFAMFLPATRGLSAAQVTRIVDCFLIAIAASGLGVVAAATTAAIRGLQKPVTAGAITLIADIASIALTIVCLFADLGLYALALALLLRSLIAAAAGLIALLPLVMARDIQAPFRWSDSIALWRQAGRFFVTSIAMRLQTQANTLLVGMFLGPNTAATYGLSVRAHETVLIILWQLNAAIGPVLAHLVGAGQQSRLDAIIRKLLPMVAAVAAVGATCVIVLNERFVTLWVGAHAFAGLKLTVIMGVALWLSALASVAYEALVARGEFAFIARVYGGASVLHILLLLMLVPFGAWAAPLALCASSLTWGATFWYRVFSEMGIKRRQILQIAGEPLAIAAGAAASGYAFMILLPQVGSWLGFFTESAAVAVGVTGVLLALQPRLRGLLRAEFLTTIRAMRTT